MNFEEMSKEELIDYIKNINESNNGKYGLIWDKEKEPEKIVEECNKYIPVLKEDENKKIENNGYNNILIEGDNFHSLEVLNYTHKETVDVIYIDPPYNTGIEDFVYNDKFINEEDGYRHSKWLNFMQKRLKVARNLLKDDGLIMISIDDNEFAQLKLLCDKIFGENNKISIHHIQVRYAEKSLADGKQVKPVMEYVLIYAKNSSNCKLNLPIEEYTEQSFCYEIKEEKNGKEIKNSDGTIVYVYKPGEWKIEKKEKADMKLLKETWISGTIYSKMSYGQVVRKYIEPRYSEDGIGCLYKVMGRGDDGLGYRYYVGPAKKNSSRCKMYSGMPLSRVEEIKSGNGSYREIPISNYLDFAPDFGNIVSEGGIAFNSGKKPVKMLKELINYHPSKSAIVLDFFAGSGSTGHAVLELNKEDNGTRKFILCTNNEVSNKLQKEYMKNNNLSEKDLEKIKSSNEKNWKEFVEKNGICSTVTYPRLKNVIKGQNKKTILNGTLRYYKTEFVENSGTRDQIYYDLTEKCIPMLCVKEDTYEIIEKNDQYAIYTNKANDKFTCVYFDTIGNKYEEFIEKVKAIEEKKVLYIFTLGNKIEEPRLAEIKNYTIEAIPQRIYDLYKKLAKMSKEN